MKKYVVEKVVGCSQQATGVDRVMVEVEPEQDWLFVEVVGSALQVWSGPRCSWCIEDGDVLKRCQLHKAVTIVARQLQLL